MANSFLKPVRIEGNVAYVPLTKGFEAVIDAADAAEIERFNWFAVVGVYTVYAARNDYSGDRARFVYMHRALMSAPVGIVVDHINQDGLDNHKANLRLATTSENAHNQGVRSNNTSGFKGVGFCKHANKWRACISLQGVQKHLGYFNTPQDASAAYDAACSRLHGSFGRFQ